MRNRPSMPEIYSLLDQNYQKLNYDKKLQSGFFEKSHKELERTLGLISPDAVVLELGCGPHPHLPYLQHEYSEYTLSDSSADVIGQLRKRYSNHDKLKVLKMDASKLSFENASFDRLIASNILEHLPSPEDALHEWHRVIRPGGYLSLILPCDPGLLWRIGRSLGPRKSWQSIGFPYDYWNAVSHINSIYNLLALVTYYFDKPVVSYIPFRVPVADLNLFVCINIRVSKK